MSQREELSGNIEEVLVALFDRGKEIERLRSVIRRDSLLVSNACAYMDELYDYLDRKGDGECLAVLRAMKHLGYGVGIYGGSGGGQQLDATLGRWVDRDGNVGGMAG